MAIKLDIKDTINRIASVGRLIDLNEDSTFAKIADSLMGLERHRYDEAAAATKKSLEDWAGKELDSWWGEILQMQRLQGVESADQLIGDSSYIARIKRYMEAANNGVSIEGVRQAAESGAGIPFRVNRSGNRIILEALEAINPQQKAGALRAVRRIAPARALIEIGTGESYEAFPFSRFFSKTYYIGDNPDEGRLTGPDWDSPNKIISLSSNKWAPAPEGSLFPGADTPSEMFKGGAWHVPNVGFGDQAILKIGVGKNELVNRLKITIGPGEWSLRLMSNNEAIYIEDVIARRWTTIDRVFEFQTNEIYELVIVNRAQEPQSLFTKGAYLGARVNSDTREAWLALGGLSEEDINSNQVVLAKPENILKNKEWISAAQHDPSQQTVMYAELGPSPVRVASFLMKTRTPGAIFRLDISSDTLDSLDDYPNLNWQPLVGIYKATNGRVRVQPFTAKHVRFTFSNLRPLPLREFHGS